MNEADFIIVGAGSAGCAMAYRLSENPKHRVLVIEAGGTDIGPFIQMPAALSYPMNMARYDWGYQTEPEPKLNNRQLVAPRGRVIGGSSSINGMVYVRGHALDYDGWAEAGAHGWAYANVLPYFRRMETSHGGEEGWRGTNGPLHVTRGAMRNPLYHAFIQAGEQAGYRITSDYNGHCQEGFGPMEMTVWNGRRWSAANAYLRPALKRPNVTMVRAVARRLLFDGTRVTGIEVEGPNGIQILAAGREIIVAASAFNSPKLLLLSGIGPAEELQELGITVVANRSGVGRNLQDHLEIYQQYKCKQPISLNSKLNWFSKGVIGAQWLLFKTGLGASNQFEGAGFIRSQAGVPYPDIQYHFLPAAIRYDGTAPVKGHGFQVHVGPMRSPSRGTVTLRSADPADAPVIRFNYMSTDQDWQNFRSCIRLTREIINQPAMREYAGEEIAPSPDIVEDHEIDEFVAKEAESAYHPCGTCKMGDANDPDAVVDPDCKVIGVTGLRLADSSIIPRITNGNLNGPSLVVGEKASDHILGRDRLPPENLVPWTNPNWETAQR